MGKNNENRDYKSGDGDGSRGDATGKLAGIGKNVNDESCSTRRARLAYQLSFETVENPRSSMPNLLIFLTFSKFVTL